jgi:hypothetical protein
MRAMFSIQERRRAFPGPGLWIAIIALFALPGAVCGEERAQDASPPEVPLDALMRLPKSAPATPVETRNEPSRAEWEARFTQARAEIERSRAALAASQTKLEGLASDSDTWQMAAPGAAANTENSPLSFKLRQDIRRQREDLEKAKHALTELRIEANLAGVPEAWQEQK